MISHLGEEYTSWGPYRWIVVIQMLPVVSGRFARNIPVSAWRTAVGPAVDRVTTLGLKRSVLHLRAQDAAWRREIERSATVIRARLDAPLGESIIGRIDIAVK